MVQIERIQLNKTPEMEQYSRDIVRTREEQQSPISRAKRVYDGVQAMRGTLSGVPGLSDPEVIQTIKEGVSFRSKLFFDQESLEAKSFDSGREAILEQGLETVMAKSLQVSNQVNFEARKDGLNLRIAKSPSDLIKSYILRSITYGEEGHNCEFQSGVKHMEFDEFDPHSATILLENNNGDLVASFRMTQNNPEVGLPGGKYCKELYNEERFGRIAEAGRMVVTPELQGKGSELLFCLEGCKIFAEQNDIARIVYCAFKPTFDMYQKRFAEQKILCDAIDYGNFGDEKPIGASWGVNDVYDKFSTLVDKFANKKAR